MKSIVATVALATALSLGGCARTVTVMSAPNLNVYSNYTNKVPGKWALFVDGARLVKTVRPDGINCAAYNWPIDLNQPFRQTVAATFRNVIESVDLLDQPVALTTLSGGGYSGLIRINADDIRAHLSLVEGFFSSTAEVTTEIDAGILVDSPSGRILGTQATGSGHGENDAGFACSGGAQAIQNSAEAAMRTVVGQLAERFSNAPQVRQQH